MIEKLKNIPIDMNGKPSAVWLKINELIDAINFITEEFPEQTYALSVAIKKQHRKD